MNKMPAFPRPHSGNTNFAQEGMTLREYAAIKLKVPDSGTHWLDDMIRQSIRDDFAAKAIQGLLLDDNGDFSDPKWLAERAYVFADAMLKAREA